MSLFRKAKSYHVTKRGTSMLLILLLILQMGAVSACKRSKPAKIAAKDGEYLFAAYQNNACEECMKEADLYSVYDTKAFFDADGNMYALAHTEKESFLVKQDMGSDTCRSLSIPIKERIDAATISSSKEIWVLSSHMDDSYHIQYALQSISVSGETVRSAVNIPGLVDQDIVALRVLDEDRLIVALSNELRIFDTQGKAVDTISLDSKSRVEDISVSDNKTIGVISVPLTSDDASELLLLDDSGKKVKNFSLPSHAKEPGIFGGANGFSSSFLISSDCYVGVLDLNTLSFTHWVQADLMQNDTPDEDSLIYEFSDVYNILAAGMAGDTIVFYGIARDVMDYSVGLFHLSFNEFTGDRTKVSIGALLDDSLFHLNELVDYYNRMQDKVYIEIRDYTESNDPQISGADNWRRSVTTMLTEFTNHSGPDMYLLEPSVLIDLQKQGALFDMTTYLDQMEESDYLPGVFALFEEGFNNQYHQDGTYFIAPYFSIEGMAYDQKIADEIAENQYTYADLFRMGEENNCYVTGTGEYPYDLFPLPLCEMLSGEGAFAAEKTDAVMNELTQLLNDVHVFNKHKEAAPDLDIDHPYFRPVTIERFDDYIQTMMSFSGGGSIGNYPCTKSTCGISVSNCFCISEQSSHKQEAWDFLAFLLAPHTQSQMAHDGQIPVAKEAFEKDIAECMKNSFFVAPGSYEDNRQFFGYPTYVIEDPDACQAEYRALVDSLLSDHSSVLYYDEVIKLRCKDAVQRVSFGEETPQQAADSLYKFVKLYRQEKEL